MLIILGVFSFAFYYTLPTCIHYAKSLSKNIDYRESQKIISNILLNYDKTNKNLSCRAQHLLKGLGLKGQVREHSSIPGAKSIVFSTKESAHLFSKYITQGEEVVPFKSERLRVLGGIVQEGDNHIVKVSNFAFPNIQKSDFQFVSYDEEDLSYLNFMKQEATNVLQSVVNTYKDECCGYESKWKSLDQASLVVFLRDYNCCLENSPELIQQWSDYYFGSLEEKKVFFDKVIQVYQKGDLSLEDKNEINRYLQLTKSVKNQFSKRSSFEFSTSKELCAKDSPLFSCIDMVLKEKKIRISLQPSLIKFRENNKDHRYTMLLNRLLFSEKQRLEAYLGKNLLETVDGFTIALSSDADAKAAVIFNSDSLIESYITHITEALRDRVASLTCDFKEEEFPICSYQPKGDDLSGCFVFSPKHSCSHFQKGKIYIVLKGLYSIANKYQNSSVEERNHFERDIREIYNCLAHLGISGRAIQDDQVLVLNNPLELVVDAFREEFVIGGSSRALMEVSSLKKFLQTKGRLEDQRQNDWVRWQDIYQQASCSMNKEDHLRATPPYKSIFFENVKLNIRKILRGERALKWGIDLAGGKRFLIGFKDHQGRPVTQKEDLTLVTDELYARLNKLGVSEVEVYREGDNVYVSIPGCETLSSSEIIGSSSMSFHVVNEQFSGYGELGHDVQVFLDYVWHQALYENRTTFHDINAIAYRLLQSKTSSDDLTKAIHSLKEAGLALVNFDDQSNSSSLDDRQSMVVVNNVKENANPLMIVYSNYALDGASLTNIYTDFTPTEGYVLHFGVKKNVIDQKGIRYPQDDFYKWTKTFCQENIAEEGRDKYSFGRGWRMAVVLNGKVISAPTLNVPLKEQACVTGNFSHREVYRLASDLKSGTMSFVPEILSEESISPELGKSQRDQGLISVILGLAALILLMTVYYRFGGIVASFAVVFNLILILAALQYLDASITLSGLAGVVLALGMAVDANVLVFERIREEYQAKGDLSLAIDRGYKRAFSAILDSNITTILAALLLLLLDTGPIKGFALTLIIGIFSSMFTSLFMTKFFFAVWLSRTKQEKLHMMTWFCSTQHDFLKGSRKLWVFSGSVLALGIMILSLGSWGSLLSMDFKGGYALTFSSDMDDVSSLGKAFNSKLTQVGLSSRDFQIETFNASKKVKIYFGNEALAKVPSDHSLERLDDKMLGKATWLLKETGLDLPEDSHISSHWAQVSGKLSSKMCHQALLGLLGALIIILVYVSIRFEWQYAVSAVSALLHDLLVTCAVLVITHFYLKKVQIDLQAIGALMTVLGYSLNNTLIIFDRIREDRKCYEDISSLSSVINRALRDTFSRTMMTTATTLSVLVILLIAGGLALFNFAFIMTIGIILGTFSSLYIAPPLFLFLMRKENVSLNKEP